MIITGLYATDFFYVMKYIGASFETDINVFDYINLIQKKESGNDDPL